MLYIGLQGLQLDVPDLDTKCASSSPLHDNDYSRDWCLIFVYAGIYVWNDIGQGEFNNRTSYFNWDRDEPNDKHYDSGAPTRCDGEDCVNIHIRNGEVTWFDLNCEIALPFVCEKSRDPYLSFAASIAISMGAGLLLSIIGGRAYMELIHRRGRKQVKQMIGEATDNDEKKD